MVSKCQLSNSVVNQNPYYQLLLYGAFVWASMTLGKMLKTYEAKAASIFQLWFQPCLNKYIQKKKKENSLIC